MSSTTRCQRRFSHSWKRAVATEIGSREQRRARCRGGLFGLEYDDAARVFYRGDAARQRKRLEREDNDHRGFCRRFHGRRAGPVCARRIKQRHQPMRCEPRVRKKGTGAPPATLRDARRKPGARRRAIRAPPVTCPVKPVVQAQTKAEKAATDCVKASAIFQGSNRRRIPIEIRPDIGAALATCSANETMFNIGVPHRRFLSQRRPWINAVAASRGQRYQAHGERSLGALIDPQGLKVCSERPCKHPSCFWA